MTTLVRNAWYVAAWSTEIDDELRRFTILGDPVLLFRRTDGTVAALEDRCPHRLLPLSKGKRIGDTVQCGYHGLTFGADGKCKRGRRYGNTVSYRFAISRARAAPPSICLVIVLM